MGRGWGVCGRGEDVMDHQFLRAVEFLAGCLWQETPIEAIKLRRMGICPQGKAGDVSYLLEGDLECPDYVCTGERAGTP